MPKICFCILNSSVCITLDQTLIEKCCFKKKKKKIILPAVFYLILIWLVWISIMGKTSWGLGTRRGEKTGQSNFNPLRF